MSMADARAGYELFACVVYGEEIQMSEVVRSNVDAIAAFDSELEAAHMVGQWKFDHLLEKLLDGPIPAGVPFLWSWQTINLMLDKSLQALPDSDTVRRTLAFSNPGLPSGSTHTLLGSVQMVMPGELAWAHAHSISALRFVIDGSRDLYTVVDGEPLPMETHDLILTPAWTMHDHHNESSRPGIWLDVLDLPLVGAMKQMAYRVLGNKAQSVTHARRDDIDSRPSFLRPVGRNTDARQSPLRFPWRAVEQQLATAGNGNSHDGVMLEYFNPLTGSAVLPTLSCNVQLFQPGFAGDEQRKTSSSLCYVIEGSGATRIDGKTFEWTERDVFVIPNWMWHSHLNRSSDKRAVLFVVNDSPLLQCMGIERCEVR
jgi:gentisate 1,2-dioxygenase/1-hydroxy-2-naphthoate dioxygenase